MTETQTGADGAEKDLTDLPIVRETYRAGDPDPRGGYGWVRVDHTILRAQPVTATPYPVASADGRTDEDRHP